MESRLKEINKQMNDFHKTSATNMTEQFKESNAVITKDVPENAVMVGIPARSVGIADSEFKPYGITPDSDKKSDNE